MIGSETLIINVAVMLDDRSELIGDVKLVEDPPE